VPIVVVFLKVLLIKTIAIGCFTKLLQMQQYYQNTTCHKQQFRCITTPELLPKPNYYDEQFLKLFYNKSCNTRANCICKSQYYINKNYCNRLLYKTFTIAIVLAKYIFIIYNICCCLHLFYWHVFAVLFLVYTSLVIAIFNSSVKNILYHY
jgi:hypothetical protein